MNKKILVICGATASGKSAYAIEQALKRNGIILNADSMQIYKYIPILTAQPSKKDLSIVPHELYGGVEIDAEFSVGKWLSLVVPRIKEILTIGKTPILVGGTGLYLKSLIEGFAVIPQISSETKEYIADIRAKHTNSELHAMLETRDITLYNRLKTNDTKRILRGLEVYHETKKPLSEWQISNHTSFFNRSLFSITLINPERQVIYNNCNRRFIKMLENGAIEEVKFIMENYPDIRYPEAIGLKEIISYLKNECTLKEATVKAQQLTRNYAKRQLTWLKHQMKYDTMIEST
ncbi:tRNA dimethylallyltransferase [Candidatus Jidaibacter acanthamoeba]|uniref:tRNA dimethylallyltransferase n=1 Tax=Candidatus Jidaibacter acanthamoebae TaxID=86105 RepID=A0A0C1QYH8_9RICK|nr:tRNA (adenosine(37)-N6)-dimethylallyltransferase MiaA [Candidatus Jidaibacter acanthamoeba]KIE05045.1 tRNA dimethylallyltransferase [Candidatus Jidaibacter acanthamoeba]